MACGKASALEKRKGVDLRFAVGPPMPDRGLLAPLSPNEEVTLRRVALGIAQPADLPAKDIERLKALALVEEHRAGLRLTPVGKKRYLALPHSTAFDSSAPDERLAKVAELIGKARN
jgi:hypothetical protein